VDTAFNTGVPCDWHDYKPTTPNIHALFAFTDFIDVFFIQPIVFSFAHPVIN